MEPGIYADVCRAADEAAELRRLAAIVTAHRLCSCDFVRLIESGLDEGIEPGWLVRRVVAMFQRIDGHLSWPILAQQLCEIANARLGRLNGVGGEQHAPA